MNAVMLKGKIFSEPVFSHVCKGESFSKFLFSAERKSGVLDILPCVIPDIILFGLKNENKVVISGELRTRSYIDNERIKHIETFVFVKQILPYLNSDEFNVVYLDGTITKEPIFRTTLSGREICDLVVICERERSKKTDCIHCILWGRNAKRASKLSIGSCVSINGRFQSRNYEKKTECGSAKSMTAYEVSVSCFEEMEELTC